jgi:hypothetical protein
VIHDPKAWLALGIALVFAALLVWADRRMDEYKKEDEARWGRRHDED